jgi:hypothetical protein
MLGASDTQLHPLVGLLMVAGFIAAIILFLWVFTRLIPRKMSGWDVLAQRFPSNDVHKFGGRFRGCNGFFGERRDNNVNGAFLIECAQEGLAVTANFARQSPIPIPWSAIREVEQIDTGFAGTKVIVNVNYEKRMGFFLPKSALPELQQNVPADRFREPNSLFAMIKDRFHNPPR